MSRAPSIGMVQGGAEQARRPEKAAEGPKTGIYVKWPTDKVMRITTERFVVRNLLPRDVTPAFYETFKTPDFRRAFPEFIVPARREGFAQLYTRPSASLTRTLAILANDRPIGALWVVTDRLGMVVQTHNFVADPDWRGWGVVHEARGGLMNALFQIGATRIYGMPREDNARAIQCYRDQGFTEEGRMRKHYPHPDGGYRDTLIFGMLPEEFDFARASALPDRVRAKMDRADRNGPVPVETPAARPAPEAAEAPAARASDTR